MRKSEALSSRYYCTFIPKANRSNVYRTLKAFNINTVPIEEKSKAKKFKD